MVAKTDPVHHALVKQFAERETGKEYLALASGVPREKSGSVTLPIGRHPTIRVKMAVVENGKPAHTDWEIIESFGDLASLIRCRIHTGRTHQIRVHLSSLGHPVVGDETYGFKPARSKVPSPPRVLTSCSKAKFHSPASGELMTVEAPVPADFSDYLETPEIEFSFLLPLPNASQSEEFVKMPIMCPTIKATRERSMRIRNHQRYLLPEPSNRGRQPRLLDCDGVKRNLLPSLSSESSSRSRFLLRDLLAFGLSLPSRGRMVTTEESSPVYTGNL